MQRLVGFLMLAVVIISPALAADQPGSSELDGKRASLQEMRSKVLARLYKEAPETRAMIQKAAGYGVFSNIGVSIIFFSAGGGNGVVRSNETSTDTYMNMGTAGLGLGIGIKDFRGVFIFHSPKAMQNFTEYGWDFSGQADAAAKSGDKGGEGSIAATVINGASIYQLTESGLALNASLQGTKYWKSKSLNQ
jgi:lipid-binding SYLF domain-containing protein